MSRIRDLELEVVDWALDLQQELKDKGRKRLEGALAQFGQGSRFRPA